MAGSILHTSGVDKIRVTSADETGNFSSTLSIPGKYRLRARWGTATGERDFEIDELMSDVQLGDIVLSRGSTLRGFLSNCSGGETIFIPRPDDLAKRLTSGIGEVRRATIASDGRFTVEGLPAGRRSVLAKCNGTWVSVSPDSVSIPEAGEIVVQFVPTTPPVD